MPTTALLAMMVAGQYLLDEENEYEEKYRKHYEDTTKHYNDNEDLT